MFPISYSSPCLSDYKFTASWDLQANEEIIITIGVQRQELYLLLITA